MSITKHIAVTTSVLLVSACAPAAQQNAELSQDPVTTSTTTAQVEKATKDNLHRETVKPGANVSMTSALPKLMRSGAFETVRLEFTEGYQDGVMTVSLEPSDGLSLFGGSNSKTFNMASPGPHNWDVDVKADTDGVYFLNVFALANGEPRSFSVRIDMGVVTQKMFDEALPADGELIEGGKMRILEAEETVQ